MTHSLFWQIGCRKASLKRRYWGLQFLGREYFFFAELYGWRAWDLGFNTAVLCIVLLDKTCNSLLTLMVPKFLEASSLPQAVFTARKKEPKHQFVTLSLLCAGGRNTMSCALPKAYGKTMTEFMVCEMLKGSFRTKHCIKHKILLDWLPYLKGSKLSCIDATGKIPSCQRQQEEVPDN